MKKHLALLLALTMTVGAALTGCGGSASSSAAASSEAGSSKASSAAAPASAETLVLGTGGTTGTYYAVGGVMQSVLNPKLTLSQLNVTSTGASKANILDVDDGVSQLATVQNDVMYYAANGTDLFESDGKFDTFSTVACLYAETCQIIASADSGIQTVADLKGKTVAVKPGTMGETYAKELVGKYGFTITNFEDSPTMYQAVVGGQAVACFEDTPIMASSIKDDGYAMKIVEGSENEGTGYGVAVFSSDKQAFLDMFNKGLANIKANGTYDEIIAKYLGE